MNQESMSGFENNIGCIAGSEERTNLIINHLPNNLKDAEFRDLFSTIGPVKSYRVMRDMQTGASFGFGFADYAKPEDAARAILQLNNYAMQNKRLKVSYAAPPGGDTKENNLYVQNIPRSYSIVDLENLFSPYGTIVEKLIFKDKATGIPKGVGFVRFDKKSQAQAAIDALNGQNLPGEDSALLVKVARDNSKTKKSAFMAGYKAALMEAGRGRGQLGVRAGFNRGNYFNMGSRSVFEDSSIYEGLGDEIGAKSELRPAGKIGYDRSSNRYNPIAGGGGYGSSFAASGLAAWEHMGTSRDPTYSRYSHLAEPEYLARYEPRF